MSSIMSVSTSLSAPRNSSRSHLMVAASWAIDSEFSSDIDKNSGSVC